MNTNPDYFSDVNAVRNRCEMYLGGKPDTPIIQNNLIKQSLCHAIDEHHENHCQNIKIELNTDGFIVSYDAGLPLEFRDGEKVCIAEEMMTVIYACKNLKKNQDVGKKCCDVGMLVVNALSSTFQVRTRTDGVSGFQSYQAGVPNAPFTFENEAGPDFTLIQSVMDKNIFPQINFDPDELNQWILEVTQELPDLSIEVYENI